MGLDRHHRLRQRKGRYEWIAPLITRAEAGELVVIVSTMAIAETIKIEGETTENAERLIQEFFDRKWVHPVAAGRRVAEVAANLRREHGIAGADSLHVATALIARTPILLTDDGRNAKKKCPLLPLSKKISLEGHVLEIMTPEDYHKMKVVAANPIFSGASSVPSIATDDGIYWLWRASKNRQLAARIPSRCLRHFRR